MGNVFTVACVVLEESPSQVPYLHHGEWSNSLNPTAVRRLTGVYSMGHHTSLTQPGETPQYTGKNASGWLLSIGGGTRYHLAPPVGLCDDQDNDTED